MTTLNDINTMCLTRLCFVIDEPEWRRHQATSLFAYRNGQTVTLSTQENEIVRLSAEDFRTFMAYRVLWGYAGMPNELLQALQDAEGWFLLRDDLVDLFSSTLAQAANTAFLVSKDV